MTGIGTDYTQPADWELDPDGGDPYADVPPTAHLVEPDRPAGWSTWRPVDVGPVLDGTWQAPEPTVGTCHGAPGLLYPGRRHDVYGASEGGKTWFALRAVLDEMSAGRAAVFVDFEDDVGGIVTRLMAMDAHPDWIRDRFAYIRPEGPLTAPGEASIVEQVIGDLRPTLAVLDGRTEGMALHGLSLLDNDDVAKYGRMVERPFAHAGAAVLALDHVVKASDARGRYALGAVHKLNGLSGAAFMLDNRRPFGRGVIGRSGIYLTKDRPGQLRRHGLPGKDGAVWLGDLVVDDTVDGFTDVALVAPVEVRKAAAEFVPTDLMAQISAVLVKVGKPLSKADLEARVNGRASTKRSALAHLVDEGFVVEEAGPRGAKLHRLVKEYPGDDASA